jgi:predicted lipid-binding transport protein (Tim44 family)
MTRNWIRLFAISSVVVLLTALVPEADARPGRGGSSGNRGSRSDFTVPSTPTAPRTTQPGAASPSVNRPQAAPNPGALGAQAAAGSRMGTIAKGFAAGLIGAGLFGLLSGSGFFSGLGSLAGILGFILQAGLIFLAVKLVMGFLRNRKQVQTAPASVPMDRMTRATNGAAAGGMVGGAAAATSAPAGMQDRPRHDAVGITPEDYQAFEQSLVGVMQAYATQDLAGLRRLAMPEVSADFIRELHESERRDEVNELGQPKLLQGDLAESWFEEQAAYATVAMRYSVIDLTRRRSTGEILSGNPHQPLEVTEIWTFRREGAGRAWMLCGIEQA